MKSWADRLRDFGVPIYATLQHEPEELIVQVAVPRGMDEGEEAEGEEGEGGEGEGGDAGAGAGAEPSIDIQPMMVSSGLTVGPYCGC